MNTSNATVISGAQATQILQRLRQQGQEANMKIVNQVGSSGVRQIIAIPISAATASSLGQIKIESPNKEGQQKSSNNPAPVFNVTNEPIKLMKGNASTSSSDAPHVASPLSVASTSSPWARTKTETESESLMSGDNVDHHNANVDNTRKRKADKGGKGLRHFSMKVCEKVQAKGTTTYNEVADELVNELTDARCASPTEQQYDQKNIRRRVYDALNVLMAMNIISKEKKEIRWLGLPTNSLHEASNLESTRSERMERIRTKTAHLQDLILQQITFKNLVEKNREREKALGGPPAPNSAIQLPFIIVNTSKDTVIDCSISNDKSEYLFNFDNTFEIHDDMEVLKRMGLSLGLEKREGSTCVTTAEDLNKARQMVPKALEPYVVQMAKKGTIAPIDKEAQLDVN